MLPHALNSPMRHHWPLRPHMTIPLGISLGFGPCLPTIERSTHAPTNLCCCIHRVPHVLCVPLGYSGVYQQLSDAGLRSRHL